MQDSFKTHYNATVLSYPGPAWRMSCNELKCTCVVKIFAGAVRVAVSPDTDCETCGSSILTVEYNPVCCIFILIFNV